MDALFCEVIGCGAPAAWTLPVSFDLLEDHLCDTHYAELRAHTPEMAERYEGLTGPADREESGLDRKTNRKNHCARAS